MMNKPKPHINQSKPDYSVPGGIIEIYDTDARMVKRTLRTLRRKRFMREHAGKIFQVLLTLVLLAILTFVYYFGR